MDDGQMLKKCYEYLNRARRTLVEAQSIINSLESEQDLSVWRTKRIRINSMVRDANRLVRKSRKLRKKYEREVQENTRSIYNGNQD